jgi:peptidoglycan/LPS O-acetylase OafA/YrhL
LKYRPDIDGLRAIAVVSVILAHAGIKWLSGGFIGVDIFFIISGYLITRHVLGSVEEGRFSFADFYIRRMRRLLPALFVVLSSTIPFSWYLLMPDEFTLYAQSLLGSIFFSANLVFWQTTNYFSPSVEQMPLIHIWSLGVEEQFYLFFPIAFLLVFRFARCWMVPAIALASIASLGLAEWASYRMPVAGFFLLPFRVWEFGIGALCAIAAHRRHNIGNRYVSILGLVAIMVANVVFDGATRHPSMLTLLPVLGTAAIIMNDRPDAPGYRLLALRPIVFIGVISYSLYLWHQPVFAYARIVFEASRFEHFIIPIALAVGLSYLSWRFVEEPFRRRPEFARPIGFAKVIAPFAGVLALLGVVFYAGTFEMQRLPTDVRAIMLTEGRPQTGAQCQWLPGADLDRLMQNCTFGEGSLRILVTGDSHSGTLVQPLKQLAEGDPDISITEVHSAGCMPIRGLYRLDGLSQGCAELMGGLFSAERLETFDTIVLVGRWPRYMNGGGFDNGEGGFEGTTFSPVDTQPYRLHRFPPPGDEARRERVGAQMQRDIRALLESGKRVILIESVPEVGWDPARLAARHLRLTGERMDALSTSFEAYRARTAEYRGYLDAIEDPRFIRFETAALFCGLPDAPSRCVAINDGSLYYSDNNHLNLFGAERLVDELAEVLRQPVAPSGKGAGVSAP